ncbi:Hypothetical protein AT6N2_L1502 [Agrobacterium tumefaciens]|nr:Hypothetical protein AT6N2_L1502 [Agrobacterium tumefaciens]
MFEGRQSWGGGEGVGVGWTAPVAAASTALGIGEAVALSEDVACRSVGPAGVAVCAKALSSGQKKVQASSRVAAFRNVGRRVAVPFTFIPSHPADSADVRSKANRASHQT